VRKLAAFCALPGEDRVLLLHAFTAAALFRLALYFFPIERLRCLAAGAVGGRQSIDRIIWAGRVAARWMPGATCLSSALALQRLLSANGHTSELHIGVARDEGKIAAHAWVEQEGRILIGEDERRVYTRLASWPIAGASPGTGTDRASPR
jgi:hypothetical protein